MSKSRVSSTLAPTNGEHDELAPEVSLPTPSATAPTPDPFDPAQYRLSPNLSAAAGVKRMQLTIPVGNPPKSRFVRTHPLDKYAMTAAVIDLKDDRETFLIIPEMVEELAAEPTLAIKRLTTGIDKQGSLFIWAVRLPGPDGRSNSWSESALQAVEIARKHWVRVSANMQAGGYDLLQATGNIPDPEWPEMSFREILSTAFKGKLVDSLDHPVIRRLRGEG